ncbi:MAG TPA: hypothetical protein VNW73_12225 [Ktedonobacteraceae bacterium]|nr:hypothetical protein [Ktedonobacteraceae bacterium]
MKRQQRPRSSSLRTSKRVHTAIPDSMPRAGDQFGNNLKEQEDVMEKSTLEGHRLILKDGRELEADDLKMVASCRMQLGESEREVAYTHRAKQIREQLKRSEIAYER